MPGYSTAIRNARLVVISDAFDAGAGPGTITFYTAPRPATGGAITTALAQNAMSSTSFQAPASGVMTANAISDDAIDATGTVAWARGADSDGNFVGDYSVGIAGSGPDGANPDIVVSTTAFVELVNTQVQSFVVTEGNA